MWHYATFVACEPAKHRIRHKNPIETHGAA
jgi:hypothetical protein